MTTMWFDHVDSFIERDNFSEEELPINNYEKEGNYEFGSELNNARDLLSSENGDDDDFVQGNLRAEVEKVYIIEVSLAGQFEIARPSETYRLLLEHISPIFVGKIESSSKLVMSKASKMLIKNMEMHVETILGT